LSEKHEKVVRLLEDLVAAGVSLGAAVVSRDGITVKAVGKLELGRETFSAMTATIMGAAEIAVREVDAGRLRSLVTVNERSKIIIVGATTDLLLVGCLPPDGNADDATAKLETAAASLAAIASGR